ncbi:MAG TPA: hypothetical protein VM347_15735 [Nonomuraea sp.]|nr:hypothetical protein [Nonomuraea sp.]
MIRRILAGAAIAGIAFGFCVSAASADVDPSLSNVGQSVLSQFGLVDDTTALNDAAKYTNIPTTANIPAYANLQDVNLSALNNH